MTPPMTPTRVDITIATIASSHGLAGGVEQVEQSWRNPFPWLTAQSCKRVSSPRKATDINPGYDEVDDPDRHKHLEAGGAALGERVGGFRDLIDPDGRHQCRVLQQQHHLIAARRDGIAKRLRQDDIAHRLVRHHAEARGPPRAAVPEPIEWFRAGFPRKKAPCCAARASTPVAKDERKMPNTGSPKKAK